ncbi:MAG: tetratricopeptide repeat protein [Phycisphaerales bacterium]|nr:tetratricopeptide repeat protein [Phycisphaerales bacterium]
MSLTALLAMSCGCSWSGVRTTDVDDNPSGSYEEKIDYVVEAQSLRDAGDDEQALILLTQAIEENPTLTTAHIQMAEIYQERGDYNDAERSWRTAAELEPRNFDAQYGHGFSLHLLNRLTEAVRAYLRALIIRPDDFDANLNLATAYFQLNEAMQALPYAEKAVRLNPEDGPAHANLGAVYSELERHVEAVREYEAAAELMELDSKLLLNLAASLGKTRRFTEMINTLDRVIAMEPSAAAYERLGYANFQLRKYTEAVSAYEKSLEQDPMHYPAHNGLGVCYLNEYLHSEKTDKEAKRIAMDHLRASLRIKKNQPRIVDWVARYD